MGGQVWVRVQGWCARRGGVGTRTAGSVEFEDVETTGGIWGVEGGEGGKERTEGVGDGGFVVKAAEYGNSGICMYIYT